jgi:hypothetical protein
MYTACLGLRLVCRHHRRRLGQVERIYASQHAELLAKTYLITSPGILRPLGLPTR